MNKKFIEEQLLPKLPTTNKELGIALLTHLIYQNDEELIHALTQYQNTDGGFGHGIEADIQMPFSNIASTNVAISILEDITNEEMKQPMIQDIVGYLESVYNKETMSFEMVPPMIEEYPHAVWWNYDQLSSFTFGNPNPEVAGFLWTYRQYVTTLDLYKFIDKVMNYIQTTWKTEASMHSLLSILRFYKRIDLERQLRIVTDIQEIVEQLVEFNPKAWDDYVLEPYKIARIAPSFLQLHKDELEENIALYERKLAVDLIHPNWQWYQFEDIFENVKEGWTALLTYEVLYVLLTNRKQ